MLRRLLHIAIIVLLLAYPLHLHAAAGDLQQGPAVLTKKPVSPALPKNVVIDNDTNRVKRPPQNHMDLLGNSTIKEVPKTKRQPKPEKIVTAPAPVDTAANKNPRSKRRPDNVERPPDIIRRNN